MRKFALGPAPTPPADPLGALAADGVIHRHHVGFSHDSQVFFVPAGRSVRVYARTSSGTPMGVLAGHTAEVTAVRPNPYNRYQAFSASLDGTVKLWDYMEGTCLATWKVFHPTATSGGMPEGGISGSSSSSDKSKSNSNDKSNTHSTPAAVLPVQHMFVGAKPSQTIVASGESMKGGADFELFINVRWDSKKKERKGRGASVASFRVGSLLLWLPGSTRSVREPNGGSTVNATRCEFSTLFKLAAHNDTPTHLALDPSLTTLAAASNRVITVYPLAFGRKNNNSSTVRRTCSRRVTAIAFHPVFGYLVTAGSEGRITMWYNILDSNFVTSPLHWHAHPVHALAFSPDGAYMFSGGEEAVLVVWHLEFKTKQFLPRLGSIIRNITISPDGNTYMLSLADNSIKIVSAVRNISKNNESTGRKMLSFSPF